MFLYLDLKQWITLLVSLYILWVVVNLDKNQAKKIKKEQEEFDKKMQDIQKDQKANPEKYKNAWKEGIEADFYFEVLLKDKEYQDKFGGLSSFKNKDEKGDFVVQLIPLLSSPYKELNKGLENDFRGEKEDLFNRSFIKYWKKNEEKFKKIKKFKKMFE